VQRGRGHIGRQLLLWITASAAAFNGERVRDSPARDLRIRSRREACLGSGGLEAADQKNAVRPAGMPRMLSRGASADPGRLHRPRCRTCRPVRVPYGDVADALLVGHARRQRNPGAGDWLVHKGRLTVIYDWPDSDDASTARVITVWSEE